MTRVFEPAELERMRDVQAGAMMDECEILRRSVVSTDAYGMPVELWTVLTATRCAISHSNTAQGVMAEALGSASQGTQVAIEMRLIRLPRHTDIQTTDHVRLTHRFGDVLAEPVDYEIVGEPQAGPSGLICRLQKVTKS